MICGTPPRRIVPPTAKPVTVDDVRDNSKVQHYHEDHVIEWMLDGTVSMLDGWDGILGRAIMPQTWRQDFTGWGTLRLAVPDVQSVAVTYRDEAGDMQPAPEAELKHDARGGLVTASGPATDLVRVDYVCALPASALNAVRAAIILQVSHMEADRTGAEGLSPAAMAMIGPIRVVRV